jgi:hypothetical protein
MHFYLTAIALSLSLSSTTAALNVGVISDMHINALYNPSSSFDKCKGENNVAEIPPLGRYGCEGPPDLTSVMV